jgi:hypothetical protein
VIETQYPLDEMFPKKYKRIDGFTSNVCETPETDDEEISDAGKEVLVIENEGSVEVDSKYSKQRPSGKNVSQEFDYSIEETGLLVYRNKGKFFVYDEDDTVTPLNEKPLTKAKVAPFIKSQCE